MLYVACECITGATVNVTREAASDVRAVRATGESCHSPVVKCGDQWAGGGGCALWTIQVASVGTCDVDFELASGTKITRNIVFRTLDGCMCNGQIAGDSVPGIGRPDETDAGYANGG